MTAQPLIYRKKVVLEKFGISETTLRRWMKDEAFPRPRQLGPRAVGWVSDQVTTWLEKDVFPFIGTMPISSIGPRDVLSALRKMESRGALDSVQRVKQVCGQVL